VQSAAPPIYRELIANPTIAISIFWTFERHQERAFRDIRSLGLYPGEKDLAPPDLHGYEVSSFRERAVKSTDKHTITSESIQNTTALLHHIP
jgi:hypothetical protein